MKMLALTLWLIMHPVHVSFTSIDQVADSDSVKVWVKMYNDDFLLDFKLFDHNAVIDYSSLSHSFPADMMDKYLDEKVIISVNNKQLEGKLINLALAVEANEISANLVYQLEIKPEIITVSNKIMTALYEDQANMTILRVRNFEEGVKLTPEKTEQTFIVR
jgi:hypothetical protein